MDQLQFHFRTLPYELNNILVHGLAQTIRIWSIEQAYIGKGNGLPYHGLEMVIEIARLNDRQHNIIYNRVIDADLDAFMTLLKGEGDGSIECNSCNDDDRLNFLGPLINVSRSIMGSWAITHSFDRAILSQKILEDRALSRGQSISIARLYTGQLCILVSHHTSATIHLDDKSFNTAKWFVDMPKDRRVVLKYVPRLDCPPLTLDKIQTNADKSEQDGDTITLTWD